MPDNEDEDLFDVDVTDVEGFSCAVVFMAEALIRKGKLQPDDAVRALASAFWTTVVAFSQPEHINENIAYSLGVIEHSKNAAEAAVKEMAFDKKHEGHQWGSA